MFNNLATLGGVPSFRLKAATNLACRMPALCSLLMKAEGIERLAFMADVTDLHSRSASPPRLILKEYNPRVNGRQNA
jgi:hypothetical protein